MKKLLLNLIVALALVNSIWPQAQPKTGTLTDSTDIGAGHDSRSVPG